MSCNRERLLGAAFLDLKSPDMQESRKDIGPQRRAGPRPQGQRGRSRPVQPGAQRAAARAGTSRSLSTARAEGSPVKTLNSVVRRRTCSSP